jgi:hypothetical protein
LHLFDGADAAAARQSTGYLNDHCRLQLGCT